MPGPLTLPPLPDLGAILRQSRHGIYNAQGVKVGSYETLDAACQGQWLKFTGVPQPPASQLYVNDFWGRRVPLSSRCVQAAKATTKGPTITQPQTVRPASAAQAVIAANTAATGQPAPIIDLDALTGLPTADSVQVDPRLVNYAVWGGLGLVGLVLLTSGNGRRR